MKLGDLLLLYRMTNGSNSTDRSLPKISISAQAGVHKVLKHVNLIFLHLNVMKVNRDSIFFLPGPQSQGLLHWCVFASMHTLLFVDLRS